MPYKCLCSPKILLAAAVLGIAACGTALRAQDDWEAAEQEAASQPPGLPQQGVFEMPEEQFDQWLFNTMDARQAKTRLDAALSLQIESVDRVCTLTEAQRKKLQLAGRGDMKRFDDSVESVRKKFRAIRRDQNKINDIWQEIQPLQKKFMVGLFHDTSLFHKVLKQTLDAQQSTQYERQQLERRRFHYEAKIGLAVNMIENGIPLRDAQRKKFVELLLEETQPPEHYGQYGTYIVLNKAASLPEEKLKPIFDDAQWRALTKMFEQAKRWKRL
jgi:hypothetical protein